MELVGPELDWTLDGLFDSEQPRVEVLALSNPELETLKLPGLIVEQIEMEADEPPLPDTVEMEMKESVIEVKEVSTSIGVDDLWDDGEQTRVDIGIVQMAQEVNGRRVGKELTL